MSSLKVSQNYVKNKINNDKAKEKEEESRSAVWGIFSAFTLMVFMLSSSKMIRIDKYWR